MPAEAPRPRRILVADDEADVRQFLSRILEDAGYQVDTAGSGIETLEKVAAGRPDLLLLDLMMPVMDGWVVLSKLRAAPDPPLVLIVSGRTGDDTVGRATREGAAAFIPKPFRFHELLATCERLLATGAQRPAPEGATVRRVARRVLVVDVTLLSKEGAPFVRGALLNVSLAGARVELDVALDTGESVRLALHPPGSQTGVTLQGRVQWRRPGPHGFSHGLAFEDLSPDEERRLGDLLGEGGPSPQ